MPTEVLIHAQASIQSMISPSTLPHGFFHALDKSKFWFYRLTSLADVKYTAKTTTKAVGSTASIDNLNCKSGADDV